MTRRLEQDLLAAGEFIGRIPLKLLAHARDAARTYGSPPPPSPDSSASCPSPAESSPAT